LPGTGRRRNECASRRLQLRLGIDQEVCGCDNLFFGLEAFADYDLVTYLRAKLNFPRLDIAFALINEDQIPGSRMKCRRSRDDELAAHRQLNANIHVHPWPQLQAWIRKHQPYRQRACVNVQLREDVLHPPVEDPTGVRVDCDLCGITRFALSSIALEYLGEHPNIRKFGY